MRIWLAPYRLQPRADLSSRSGSRERAGVILRVETPEGDGFADLHPWPELGDEPLNLQLESLRAEKPLALAARSLVLASEDAQARSRRRSLFEDLRIPPSHFLVTDVSRFGLELNGAIEHDGFRVVKLKLGRDLPTEARQIARLQEDEASSVQFRFDFNSSLKPGELDGFLESLPSTVRARIEFIEDPFAFDTKLWAAARKRLQVNFAADFAAVAPNHAAEFARSQAANVLVVKPARQDDLACARAFLETSGHKVVATTSMDHPLGQIAAAFHAAKLGAEIGGALGVCGLLSHTAYFPNEFSESLRAQGPRLLAPEGTGLGFDDLLNRQNWESL